jgi:CMP-N,N'-diacetyllegionaminic acid synthase
MPNVVAIIPARGGSKGLPRKNILPLAGKPVIAYSIETARACPSIDRVIVTTDDQEIADISRRFGAEVPFLRPPELSSDYVTIEDTLRHTVEWLEDKDRYPVDILVYFQPTDFFKQAPWVEETIQALVKDPALESALTACKDHKNYWRDDNGQWVKMTSPVYEVRQKRKPVYREDTGLGCATRGRLVRAGRRLGDRVLVFPKEYPFFDIHSEFDLWMIEQVLTRWKGDIAALYHDMEKA